MEEVTFRVKQRGVRERWEVIQGKWQERMRNEEKASGIAPEPVTELDNMIQEITEKERLADETRDGDAKFKKAYLERETAAFVRKQAMETFSETEKGYEVENESSNNSASDKRRRRRASDAVEYLREKSAVEMRLREEELATKERQQELDKARRNSLLTQQQETLKALIQMQQQQTNAMIQVFERVLPKKP